MNAASFWILLCLLFLIVSAREQELASDNSSGRLPRRNTDLTVGLPFIFGMDLNRNRDAQAGNQTRMDLGVCFTLFPFSAPSVTNVLTD